MGPVRNSSHVYGRSLAVYELMISSYGKDDELGMLNRLTDDVVLEAAKEIKTGKR